MTQNKSYGTTGIDSLEVGGNSPIGGMFTSAIASGKALADNGELYDSVQTAVDNATGIVFVGEGTFNENVTISTAGLTLQGSGHDTLIDGLNSGNAVTIDANNVIIQDLSVRTASGSGPIDGVGHFTGTSATIKSVTVRGSSRHGIRLAEGGDHIISDCIIEDSKGTAITVETNKVIVSNCVIEQTTDSPAGGIVSDDDNIISNCIIQNTFRDGVATTGTDCIFNGLRIRNAGNDGFQFGGGGGGNGSIVSNCRISDSANTDLDGIPDVLDDVRTGSAN